LGCKNDDFNKLADEFQKIIEDLDEKGASNKEVEDIIKVVKDKFAELAEYCEENPDVLPTSDFVKSEIRFISEQITSLTKSIKEMMIDIQANGVCNKVCKGKYANYTLDPKDCICFCALKCDNTIMKDNKRNCFCEPASYAQDLYRLLPTLYDLTAKLQSTFTCDGEKSALETKIYDLTLRANELKGDAEWKPQADQEKLAALTEEITLELNELAKSTNAYIEKKVPCKDPKCRIGAVPSLENCDCFYRYSIWDVNDDMLTLSVRVGKFPTSWDPLNMLPQVKGNISSYREAECKLGEYIRNLGPSVDPDEDPKLQDQIKEMKKQAAQISALYWTMFDSTPTGCVLNCKDNEVANLNADICECMPVDRYPEFKRIDFNQLRKQVDDLNTKPSNKDVLYKQIDNMEAAQKNLTRHITEDTKTLDVDAIHNGVKKVMSLYDDTLQKIQYLSTPDATIKNCGPCPGPYTQSSSCECSCVKECDANKFVLDPYGCKCVEKNNCKKVNSDCNLKNNELLDYVACQCKVAF
jgi:hypothetical protein